jgi:hypothetical protein
MVVTTITDTTVSRALYGQDNIYLTARNMVNAFGALVSNQFYVGQYGAVPYQVFRGCLVFDTSVIPAGAIIISAKVSLYMLTDESDVDFSIIVMNGQPVYPHNPVVAGDYDRTNYVGNGGTLNTAGIGVPGRKDIPLNATGVSWINTGFGAFTKFQLQSTLDIAASAPAGDEYIAFCGPTQPTREPKLEITWVAGTVTTITDNIPLSRQIEQHGAVYLTVHDDVNGANIYTDLLVGQGPGGGFQVLRSYLIFDTSSIPLWAIVVAARLHLCQKGDWSTTDYDLVVQNGQPTYPHNPVVVGDFDMTQYAGNGGSFNTVGMPGADVYFWLDLNATGIGWINKGGLTKLCLRTSEDIASTFVGGNQYQDIHDGLDAGQEPQIEIIWTTPPRGGAGYVPYGIYH